MLDVKNPEIDVDALMQRIEEKVRLRSDALSAEGAPAPPLVAATSAVDQALSRARQVAFVGGDLPAMNRTHGLARMVARPVAKAFLRIAQLITRDQRTYNLAVLDALGTVHDASGQALSQIAALRTEVAALREQASQTQAEVTRLRPALEEVSRTQRDHAAELAELRTAMSLQERRLAVFLEEARRRLPEPLDREQLQRFAEEGSHLEDARYLGFEDAFRGSREEIKKRVAVYLALLREGSGPDRRPILDVGCGRGELLEVLRDHGLPASGIDSNRAAVEQCQARGLDAATSDAFDALAKVPDGSLGALTAIHVVEHLPVDLVFRLLDEALRVLRPGGVAIFETPNPQNLLVGACTFYVDPTHRNPVHPQTLHYLVEARGMVRVETMLLHPYPAEKRIPDGESVLARTFNDYFYGPQDYAVVGRRP